MDRALEDQLREYAGLVESLAERRSRRNRSEFDDLVQEGMIACWEALKLHRPVSEEDIEKRMTKWLRYRGRQQRDVPISYDRILPMEDLRAVNAATRTTRTPEGHGPDEAE